MSTCEKIDEGNSVQRILLLKQFRINLSDIITSDVTDGVLLKWLRTRNLNLRKSEEIYRVDYKLREIFRISEVETYWKVPEVIQIYEFANHIGFAKDGTPIHYMAMGRGDLKGFLLSLDLYDIYRYGANVIEKDRKRCLEQSRKLGKEIDDVTYIVDMEHFSVRQVFFSGVVESGLNFFSFLQDHFPEIWKVILIVNAPVYFHTVYNIFKPVFRHTFLRKVHVVSRAQTPSLLLKYVDAEVLPAFLGGKRVDSMGDPMCSEFMKFGGIVPEKYYLRNRTPLMPTDLGAEDVWVPPKSVHNAFLVVREANSKMHVEIRTGGSIFAVMYYCKFVADSDHTNLPGKNEHTSTWSCNAERVGPIVHFQTHLAPLDNFCVAPWPGIYIFNFDNSNNWLTSRRCIFRLRVIPPSEDKNLVT